MSCRENTSSNLAGIVSLVSFVLFTSWAARGEEPRTIDVLLKEKWKQEGITPAPAADDLEFLRRVSLDLIGRIPTVDEIRQFRMAPNRRKLIDRLLNDPQFARFQAELWTAALNGYSNAFQSDRDVLRKWLEEQFSSNQGFDQIATSLIAAEGSAAFDGPVNFLLRHPEQPTVKVCRMFLGVRLDCARCHDHPYAKWKQDDFEQMNRFFQVIRRRELSEGNPQIVNARPESNNLPRFLTGATPKTGRWRDELALFIVSCKPFRRNLANRIWYQLFGRGIVHPPDDFHPENPPVAPELLNHLMEQLQKNKFRIKPLFREICLSDAYNRSSKRISPTKTDDQDKAKNARVSPEHLFARHLLKPMTPEQLYDSSIVALGRRSAPTERRRFLRNVVRQSLDEDYSDTWQYRETLQGLMSRLDSNVNVNKQSLDFVFLRALSRYPTDEQRRLCQKRDPKDVFFALLLSNEFYFNH